MISEGKKNLLEGGHAVASTSCFFPHLRLLSGSTVGTFYLGLAQPNLQKAKLKRLGRSTAVNLKYKYL